MVEVFLFVDFKLLLHQCFIFSSQSLDLKNVFLFAFLQRIMRLGFDWDTTDMSILLLAKLAKPLMGTARIVINSLHIKGDVC